MEQVKSLRERMVGYEQNLQLDFAMPIVVRLDGVGFSKHKFAKPFDPYFNQAMKTVAVHLAKIAQGLTFIYTQSDELSMVFLPPDNNKQIWFGGKPYKLTSLSAVEASLVFTETYNQLKKQTGEPHEYTIYKFDSRVFNIPREELPNYLIFRSRDAYRNSICQIARQHFSHSELFGKNTDQVVEMLEQRNIQLYGFKAFNLLGGIQLPKQQIFSSYERRNYEQWNNLIEVWENYAKGETI